MRRHLLLIIVILGLAPTVWLRTPLPADDAALTARIVPVALPTGCCSNRMMQFSGAWQIRGNSRYRGGYSGLIAVSGNRMVAFGDFGNALDFATPTAGEAPGATAPRIRKVFPELPKRHKYEDIEAAAADPATGTIWLATEASNAIVRLGAGLSVDKAIRPRAMADWPLNTGPEAMTRLGDGRFIVLCECFTAWGEHKRHPALLFAGDPVESHPVTSFTVTGPEGYRPTDAATLPDGRVLVVMRRVSWWLPPRFETLIALFDPSGIKPGGDIGLTELMRITPPLPRDNYEALALQSLAPGKVALWLLSDDNKMAVLQRSLLLRFDLDLRALPDR